MKDQRPLSKDISEVQSDLILAIWAKINLVNGSTNRRITRVENLERLLNIKEMINLY